MKSDPSVAVKVQNLHFTYGKGSESLEALKGIGFEAPRGKITGILGPNGSGKSTTFKILSTQLESSSGEALVGGVSLKNRDSVRSKLGVTFQSPSLDPLLTVRENLEIQAALFGLEKNEAKKRIAEVLKLFSVEDRQNSRVKVLSGGLARRVELGKSLLNRPEILLLDEPTAGLDPRQRKQFWEELRRLCNQGMSLLVTTHLMDEADLCDQIVFLTEGKVAAHGSPAQLKDEAGGDILIFDGPGIDLASLKKLLSEIATVTFSEEASAEKWRVESREPTRVLQLLLAEFGAQIKNLHWDKPTLGDVYLSKTGKNL